MLTLATVVRKIMGLPEPEKGKGGTTTPSVPHQSETPRRNPWETAGRELRRADAPAVESSPSATSSAEPWPTHEERSGAVFMRRFGRGLVWTVVVLAAVTGVRSWFWPDEASAPAPAPVKSAAPSYPDAEAQAVASRFARAYLEWDEDAAE
ncbi:hypothetical protein AB4Z54_00325, partial [Streptomyces sp. MCAF7]